ncbi:hypothetical protein JCM19232_4215 [Vibrio ishigakensis]|uniref:LysM domain-containing protein n=1 Tax=Vibrio ishigakensis TaxID=1481914 RepID=A0A0B8PE48_9VIBR|nr:hypothetical protein JCM19232_4215 [Vibrio ishigakensis]
MDNQSQKQGRANHLLKQQEKTETQARNHYTIKESDTLYSLAKVTLL